MRINKVNFVNFKRFKHLKIESINPDTKLVIVAGPNGTGKSSLFDGFKIWQISKYQGFTRDSDYYDRPGESESIDITQRISIEFDQEMTNQEQYKKSFYVRSAYRHEADFNMSTIQRSQSPLDVVRFQKMNEQDVAVSSNYQQLVGLTFEGMFDDDNNELKVPELRDKLIGEVRQSMLNVFPDLTLEGLQSPMTSSGSFFFQKGSSHGWHYKNLSGGERAVFDILLDIIVKRKHYDNTVYCIDEPETHLNTSVQGILLREIVRLLPDNCQLWISTHSIGMMREALKMYEEGEKVTFLNFGDRDFDAEVDIEPSAPDRQFWKSILNVALDDLAELVAPREVVLVEGMPLNSGRSGNVEFDAKCLRKIFEPYRPNSGFVSVGGSSDVQRDRLALGSGITALVPGSSVIRLIDRDERTVEEIEQLSLTGCKVLELRDIENYLLADEILMKLCDINSSSDKARYILDEKARLLQEAADNGKPADDVKSIGPQLKVIIKRTLSLTQPGNSHEAFLKDVMAPLITLDTETYRLLEQNIFGRQLN